MFKRMIQVIYAFVFIGFFSFVFMFSAEEAYAWTGSGSQSDPYVIYTTDDFLYFAKRSDSYNGKYLKLGSNLDFSGENNFFPIGYHRTFEGTFDGNGYTISNVTIGYDYDGIFHAIRSPAVLKNIKVRNIKITDSLTSKGILVGGNSGGQIINTSVRNSEIKSRDGSTGGLVGVMWGGSIANSYVADVYIEGVGRPTDNFGIGGIVGTLRQGTIQNSFFSGKITAYSNIGGIAGYIEDYGGVGTTVKESAAFVKEFIAKDQNGYIGGITSKNYGTIRDSYAIIEKMVGQLMGGIAAVNSKNYVSIDGRWTYIDAEIINTYAYLKQLDVYEYWREKWPNDFPLRTGGIVYENSGTIRNSYFASDDNRVTGVSYNQNLGIINNSSKKTYEQLKQQNTYQNWDFTNIWQTRSNNLPIHKKANLIDLNLDRLTIEVQAGKSVEVPVYAVYSNGTEESIASQTTVDLIQLPGSTYSKTSGNKIKITGGQIAQGHLKVTYKGVTNYFTVKVTQGDLDTSKSTIEVWGDSIIADGNTTAMIRVNVVDGGNNPLKDLTVNLYDENGISSIDQVQPKTDQYGNAYFNVKSSKLGTARYYAVVQYQGQNKTITQKATVNFVAGPPVASNSSIFATSTGPYTVGQKATVQVSLRDAYQHPVKDVTVEVIVGTSIPSGYQTTITPLNVKTDESGLATFEVTSTWASNITLRVKANDNELSGVSTNITFVPGAPYGTYSEIIMVSDPLEAGTSRQFYVQIKDQYGNQLKTGGDSQYIQWDSSIRGNIVLAHDHGNGTYTFTYTAPTVAGSDTIKGSIGGVSISNSIQLEITPGIVSKNVSTMNIDKTTIRADHQQYATITVEVMDEYLNPIPNQKVVLQQTGSSIITPHVSDDVGTYAITDSKGIAKFNINSTKAETIVYKAVVVDENGNEVQLTQTVSLTIMSGPMYEGNTEMSVSSNRLVADGSGIVTITVQLKDEFGNNLTEDGGIVEIYANSDPLSVTQAVYGTYQAELIAPTIAGKVVITAYIQQPNGDASLLPVHEEINFIPGPATVETSTVEARDTFLIADGSNQTKIVVQLKDQFYNDLTDDTIAGHHVEIFTDLGSIGPTNYIGDGQFEAILTTSTDLGTATITATLNQQLIQDFTTVDFTVGPVSLAQTTITADQTSIIADGLSTTIIEVQLMDDYGHKIEQNEGKVELQTTLGSITEADYVGNGLYQAILTADTITGKAIITGSFNGLPLLQNKEIEFIPGPATVETSIVEARDTFLIADGSSQTKIVVQLKDQFYNDLTDDTIAGHHVEIFTDLGTIGPTNYIGDGQFEAILTTSTDLGTAKITATLNQQLIQDFTTVDFTVGPVSLVETTITADRTRMRVLSTTNIKVQLMDDYGHKVERYEGEVVLTTTLGSISEAVYVSDGLYEAKFSSSIFDIGEAIITGTLNGKPILNKVVISLIPLPPASPSQQSSNAINFTVLNEEGHEEVISFTDEEITSNDRLSIDALWVNHEVQVVLSSQALEEIMNLNPSQHIEIQTGEITYLLPIDQLDLNEISRILENDDFEIMITLRMVDEEIISLAHSTLEALGSKILVDPVQFMITATTNDGSTIEVATFSRYVIRTFEIDGKIDTYYVTGARIDPDTGEFEPVPTTFEYRDGKTIVYVHSLSNSYYTVVKNNITFTDMKAHWAKTEVERMANKWIIKGKGNNLFDPRGSLTRAEAIALLVRALGLNIVNEMAPYQDIADQWFTAEVNTAYRAGLIVKEGMLLEPTKEIPREELAMMLVRAIQYVSRTTDQGDVQQLLRFNDHEQISKWARESVAIATQLGIIKGDEVGNLKPLSSTSRAEAAVMLDRLLRVLGLIN